MERQELLICLMCMNILIMLVMTLTMNPFQSIEKNAFRGMHKKNHVLPLVIYQRRNTYCRKCHRNNLADFIIGCGLKFDGRYITKNNVNGEE